MTPGVQAPKARRVNIEIEGTGERVVLSHRSLPGVIFFAFTGVDILMFFTHSAVARGHGVATHIGMRAGSVDSGMAIATPPR